MNRIATIVALTLLTILWIPMVRAQGEFRGLDAARDGSGTLSIADQNDEALKRVSITLGTEGRAGIELTGRRKWDLDGRWSTRTDKTIELRLDRGLGADRLDARGTVTLRGENDFTRLRLEGEIDGKAFEVTFDTERSYDIPVQRFDVNDDGSGTVTMFGRSDQPLTHASIKLDQDGTAEITFNERDTQRLTGRWHAESTEALTLEIDRAFGNSGSGSGRVYLGIGMRIDGLEIQGASGARNYKLDFTFAGRGDGRWRDRNVRIESMDKRLSGAGDLRVGRSDDRITRANVDLRRGGVAMIRLFGHDTWTIEGTWKQGRANMIDVVINRLNDVAADGSATVYLDGKGAFERVDVRGRSRNDDFSTDFRTPQYGTAGGGGGAVGSLRSMDLLRNGTGQLAVGGDREIVIVRTNVDLRTNGDAMIKVFEQGLFSGGTSYTLTGRWSNGRSNTIDLDIRKYNDDTATGSGKVYLKGTDDFDRVEISATRDRDRIDLRFDVETTTSTTERPREGSLRSMDVLQPGSGQFTLGNNGKEYGLSKVNVDLRPNGDAMVKVFSAQLGGSKSWELLGRWTQDRDGTVRITIQNALDDNRASGSGRIYLRSDTKFDRVEIDGRADGNDFTVTFRAD